VNAVIVDAFRNHFKFTYMTLVYGAFHDRIVPGYPCDCAKVTVRFFNPRTTMPSGPPGFSLIRSYLLAPPRERSSHEGEAKWTVAGNLCTLSRTSWASDTHTTEGQGLSREGKSPDKWEGWW
jgi:hypothetical protein